jgi:hypothetical protein
MCVQDVYSAGKAKPAVAPDLALSASRLSALSWMR